MAKSSCNPVELVFSDDDLFAEILLLLPAKPLLGYQTVSKRWRSIISDPNFRRRHTRRHFSIAALPTSILMFGFTAQPRGFPFIDLEQEAKIRHFNFPSNALEFLYTVHSCNGLICANGLLHFRRTCVVANIMTGEFRNIQLFDMPGGYDGIRYLHIAFDPSKSEHYKIVCLWSLPYRYESVYGACVRDLEIQFEPRCHYFWFWVYSSETGVWRKSDSVANYGEQIEEGPVFDYHRVYYQNATYWNGAMHWLDSCMMVRPLFLCFDTEEEHLKAMPDLGLEMSGGDFYFGESRGCLYYVASDMDDMLNVWQLREDYSGWLLYKSVELDRKCTLYPSLGNFLLWTKVLFLDLEGEDGKIRRMLSIYCRASAKLVMYNPLDMAIHELYDLREEGLRLPLAISPAQYIESLASV